MQILTNFTENGCAMPVFICYTWIFSTVCIRENVLDVWQGRALFVIGALLAEDVLLYDLDKVQNHYGVR